MDRNFKDNLEYANDLDSKDSLRHFRQKFYLKKGEIYMCGNALGLASVDAEESLLSALDTWKNKGLNMWKCNSSKYYLYSDYIAELMAPLVGAKAEEISLSGSTTCTIHQAISTFYKPTEGKYKILVDDINFPTDRYAVDSQVRLKGYEPKDAVKVVNSKNNFMNEDDVIEALTPEVALVFLPTVYYKTSQVLDMENITKVAKQRDITIGWDLSHAIGAIELNLNSLDADFAVWCTYKYLNGGPGSVAGLYINRKHFHLLPGLAGWYGNRKETQFSLNQEFDHQKDARGWQIGTPHIFSMATLEGSLKMLTEAGMSKIRRKSLHITAYLMYLVDKKLVYYGFSVGNLREDTKRGGHVCLRHEKAYKITLALKARGVLADFRQPNVIRLTPTALYSTYKEVYEIIEILLDIAKNKRY